MDEELTPEPAGFTWVLVDRVASAHRREAWYVDLTSGRGERRTTSITSTKTRATTWTAVEAFRLQAANDALLAVPVGADPWQDFVEAVPDCQCCGQPRWPLEDSWCSECRTDERIRQLRGLPPRRTV